MFTGLVRLVCQIKIDGYLVYLFATQEILSQISIGDSICVNGVCLTVAKITETYCLFELSKETIQVTTLKIHGTRDAHVELAMKDASKYDGHIVLGHIHKTCTVVDLLSDGSLWIDIGVNMGADSPVVYKGSIAINGVSLTIAEIKHDHIRIALIPETLKKTTLGSLKCGDLVNVEFDTKTEARTHSYYMKLAMQEAEKGRCSAPPNPWVGCIIVNNYKIIGKGYHAKAGQPHAEVNAINSCSEDVAGSTLYCTLEPCNHYGRTPPCTDLLTTKGIKTVVIGLTDPDSRVSGKGIEKLRNAKIEVVLMKDIDTELHYMLQHHLRQYIYQRQTGLPYVTVKIALSADGCYIDDEQSDKWITHHGSRQELYKIWASSQAVLIGGKTVQRDNCDLTTNDSLPLSNGEQKSCPDFSFKKVVFDGSSLTSLDRKIFDDENCTVVTNDPQKWNSRPTVRLIKNEKGTMRFVLGELNVMHCLVEGGGILHKSFFEEGLVNEIVIFRGSKLLGKDAYHWNVPQTTISLREVKVIEYDGVKNIMERYIVDNSKPKESRPLPIEFSDINYAIAEFARGGFVLVLDDEDRENEGDLIVAASLMTETQMTEMINHTTGIICVPMEKSHAQKLNLYHMVQKNTDKHETAFTTSVDSKLTSTGVSSRDRLLTVHTLANNDSTYSDLNKPGHIFPLIANKNGLKERRGHTEAAVELCKLAGIFPRVAVIGELVNIDGTMKRRDACFRYARTNNIPIIKIDQLLSVSQPETVECLLECLAECELKSEIGSENWTMKLYRSDIEHHPHKFLIYNAHADINLTGNNVPVRIHSECFTGDVLKSEQCDCGPQLASAMKYISDKGYGIIIMPAGHEGRGIGIIHKIKAYKLQKTLSVNTFQANNILGFEDDERVYDEILKTILYSMIGDKKVELLTENPNKVSFLGEMVDKVTPVLSPISDHNSSYIHSKRAHFTAQERSLGLNVQTREQNLEMETVEPFVEKKESFPEIDLTNVDCSSYRIGIVYSSWHGKYVTQIRDLLKTHLTKLGVRTINEYCAPGSNEIPFLAMKKGKENDGMICVGILIKGDTLHFENVSSAVSNGIMQAQLSVGIPMMNCIYSCLNYQQVVDRIDGEKSTLEYVAKSVLKMIHD